MSVKNIKDKVRKLKELARQAGKPTPAQVAEALQYHGEKGSWPPDASPEVIKLAEKMQTGAGRIMSVV